MKKLVFITMIVILATSCGKYEDGPGFSLNSKTKRLAREWTIDKVIENGTDITATYLSMVTKHTMLFIDYGSLKETINQTILAKGWEWGEKKETLIITYKLLDVESTVVFNIRRLTTKEFWYTTTLDNKDYEFHWKANK